MPRLPKYPRSHTVVYATDIKLMNGWSFSMGRAYRLLRKIRKHYGKPPKAPVTVEEFCKYVNVGIPEVQLVIDAIRRKEDIAIYAKMKNPPRHALAVINIPEDDWYICYN